MKCKICNRAAEENTYCSLHLNAYRNIMNKFDAWKQASDIVWNEYLIEIQKNSLTGVWAKEVIKDLIKGENGNVK